MIPIAHPEKRADVLIIGAGPAGSAAAAILAEYGHDVLVLERERFPRYHVGESMVPFTYYPLQRLGLIPKLKASHFVQKYSVQFIERNGRANHPLYFFSRYDRATVGQTWQVLRSEFDQMLADHAREKGALICEQTTVQELIQEHGRTVGLRAIDPAGRSVNYFAPITLDCSGKESFAATRRSWRLRESAIEQGRGLDLLPGRATRAWSGRRRQHGGHAAAPRLVLVHSPA